MLPPEIPSLLIVDEDKDVLQALEKSLRVDFQVYTQINSNDAAEFLKKNSRVSVIMVSQNLPDRPGLDLLREAITLAPTAVRVLMAEDIHFSDITAAINEVCIHRLIARPWNEDHLRIHLQECANHHRSLVENEVLTKLAITDPVTMLYNHRYFQEQLKKDLDRSKRYHRSLTLLMADVDHFKAYNDQHGHPAGDEMLFRIGKELVAAVRGSDAVCRYGGEEFAIILPETKAEDGFEVAERIRNRLAKLGITLSLGVAGFPEKGESSVELIRAADEALFEAKRIGRNRTVVR